MSLVRAALFAGPRSLGHLRPHRCYSDDHHDHAHHGGVGDVEYPTEGTNVATAVQEEFPPLIFLNYRIVLDVLEKQYHTGSGMRRLLEVCTSARRQFLLYPVDFDVPYADGRVDESEPEKIADGGETL